MMVAGVAEYADVIELLNAEGLLTRFTQTGGMNAALEVQLETGHTLHVTDENDSLAWRRAELAGWSVGLYAHEGESQEGAIRFASRGDTSTEALRALIHEVLFTREEAG